MIPVFTFVFFHAFSLAPWAFHQLSPPSLLSSSSLKQTHAVMSCRNSKKTEKVMFGDVVGCDEAKEEVKQVNTAAPKE